MNKIICVTTLWDTDGIPLADSPMPTTRKVFEERVEEFEFREDGDREKDQFRLFVLEQLGGEPDAINDESLSGVYFKRDTPDGGSRILCSVPVEGPIELVRENPTRAVAMAMLARVMGEGLPTGCGDPDCENCGTRPLDADDDDDELSDLSADDSTFDSVDGRDAVN